MSRLKKIDLKFGTFSENEEHELDLDRGEVLVTEGGKRERLSRGGGDEIRFCASMKVTRSAGLTQMLSRSGFSTNFKRRSDGEDSRRQGGGDEKSCGDDAENQGKDSLQTR